MPKMRNLGYIHVPGVQLSRNLAEIFIKTKEAQKDLKFVDSLVPTYKNLSRKMRFSGSYLTTFLLVFSRLFITLRRMVNLSYQQTGKYHKRVKKIL